MSEKVLEKVGIGMEILEGNKIRVTNGYIKQAIMGKLLNEFPETMLSICDVDDTHPTDAFVTVMSGGIGVSEVEEPHAIVSYK